MQIKMKYSLMIILKTIVDRLSGKYNIWVQ